jgi:hypothetical protein
MKVEEIAEAVAKLPPGQLAREAVAASAIGEEAVVADAVAAYKKYMYLIKLLNWRNSFSLSLLRDSV